MARKQPDALTFPLELATPAFTAKWEEWLRYRRLRRLTTNCMTMQRQLDMLSELAGTQGAIESIEQSIEKGWAGLFPPKEKDHGRNSTARAAGQSGSQEAWDRKAQTCQADAPQGAQADDPAGQG